MTPLVRTVPSPIQPFRVLQFEITPVVVFQAVWQNSCLRIDFEDCQLKGLGVVQETIRFECRAVLTPSDQRLDAEGISGAGHRQDASAAAQLRGP